MDRRLPQPIQHLHLELLGLAAVATRPGNAHLHAAMFRALHPRDIGFYPGLILAGIQVAPTARPTVVARTGLPAIRATQWATRLGANEHRYGLQCLAHRHVQYLPRLAQAQNLRVEICIVHTHL